MKNQTNSSAQALFAKVKLTRPRFVAPSRVREDKRAKRLAKAERKDVY